eukprot:5679359-Amphidinium_carterae.1
MPVNMMSVSSGKIAMTDLPCYSDTVCPHSLKLNLVKKANGVEVSCVKYPRIPKVKTWPDNGFSGKYTSENTFYLLPLRVIAAHCAT